MPNRVSRRKFLWAAGASGLTAADALAFGRRRCQPAVPCPPHPCPPFPHPIPPQPPAPPVPSLMIRPNVLSLDSARLESLRRGVMVMKALPDSDRRSWAFQAAIHGTTDTSATDPLFNQCKHGTVQFLAWHRGYLHFFERILRWASGDPSLTLPFWDWTAARVLPEAFRSPADAKANPLYEPLRKANDGSALPPDVVVDDLTTALGQTTLPGGESDGFSADLEGSPHGLIHTLVGGPGGVMSKVATAANDPIFWLHHANIDRLWDVWLNQGGGRANPSDPGYLDQEYTFADETGGTSTVRVASILTSAGLGYAYEGVPSPAASAAATTRATATAAAPPPVAATSADAADRAAPLDRVKPTPLGFEEKRVKLNTVPEARAALARATPPAVGAAAAAPTVKVIVEGVSADAAPDFVFRVYVNLPEGERGDAVLRRHYVGSINFFGKTRQDRRSMGHGHAHAGEAEFDATFDATKVLARLRTGGRFDPDALAVTILPTAPTAPALTPAQVTAQSVESARQAKASFKRVSVRVHAGK